MGRHEVKTDCPAAAGTLAISGADATAFLHAQLASDVHALAVGHWQWSAWLDAQGRVRALLQLARTGDADYVALLRGGEAAAMAAALGRFVLRARVALRAGTRALHAAAAAPMHHAASKPDDALLLGMGTHAWRIEAPPGTSPRATEADALLAHAWRTEIEAGWPWLPPTALDALTPPALGLEHLGAVRFDKGCYPGQEIAARLHFRGGNKRHLVTLQGDAAALSGLLEAHPETLLPLCTLHAERLLVLGVLNTASAAAAAFEPLLQARHAA